MVACEIRGAVTTSQVNFFGRIIAFTSYKVEHSCVLPSLTACFALDNAKGLQAQVEDYHLEALFQVLVHK